jgi:hypothetical protein
MSSLVAVGTILSATGFVYLRRLIHNSLVEQVVHNRNELPSMTKICLGFLIGRKESKPQKVIKGKENQEVELLNLEVQKFNYTPDELKQFIKLCGNSKSSLFHIFPHVLAQRSILTLTTNANFPITLIGSLHLKSFFELHNAKLMEEFVGLSKGNENNALNSDYSLVAKYWGMVPNQKKGMDIVVTLELFHKAHHTLVWTEVMVMYTRKTIRKYEINPAASAILAECYKHYDFTNLVSEKISSAGKVRATADDTWEYGILSNDVNPIHMNGLAAKLFGHKSRISHGALVLGKAMTSLEQANGGRVPMKFGISLKGPIACNAEVDVQRTNPDTKHEHFDLYAGKSSRPNICVRVLTSSNA